MTIPTKKDRAVTAMLVQLEMGVHMDGCPNCGRLQCPECEPRDWPPCEDEPMFCHGGEPCRERTVDWRDVMLRVVTRLRRLAPPKTQAGSA